MKQLKVELRAAQESDAAPLAELRVAAMRPSLEAVGRFDLENARRRFLDGFVPSDTQVIESDGAIVGVCVLRRWPAHLVLDHLYVLPSHQAQGLGRAVLAEVLRAADAAGMPVRVTALKGSRSNAFYLRHGFALVEASEWDNHYERRPARAN